MWCRIGMFVVVVGAQRKTRMLRVSLRINNKHKASHLLCFVDNSWRCNLFSLKGYMHWCKDSAFQSFFVSNSWSTSIVCNSSSLRQLCRQHSHLFVLANRQIKDNVALLILLTLLSPLPSHGIGDNPGHLRRKFWELFSGSQTWKRIFRAQTVSGDASFHLTRSLW